MGTYWAPLVADLFFICYERDFMMSLSDDKQSDIIDTILTIGHEKYTLKSFNLIKQILLIPKPRFGTCICSFLMILFLPNFMINLAILILKLSISRF